MRSPDALRFDEKTEQFRIAHERLRRLRAQSPRLPVIVLTARDSAADRTTALAAGADGYVTKPFGVAALAEQIRRLLTGDPASASVTTTRG